MELPEGLISLENVVVFVFCEVIGGPFCYAAAQEILDGKYVSGIIGFAVGVPFAITGFGWAWFKPWLRKALATVNQTISPNYLIVALLVLFVYVAGPSFLGRVKAVLNNSVALSSKSVSSMPTQVRAASQGNPTVEQRGDEEITPAQSAFLQQQMLRIPRPCEFRIVAPPAHLALRNLLRSMATAYGPNGTAACSVMVDAEDSDPAHYVGTKPKYPTSGVFVMGAPDSQAAAEDLQMALRQIGMKVVDKGDIAPKPPGQGTLYPPDFIYISLGTGSLWK